MVLTVPSQIKPQSKEYTVCVAEDGVIFYIPANGDQEEIYGLAKKHGAFLPYQF
ncbi:hypothetical protein FC60_GL001597 [Limosilactobacillus gastricus DSM 16045]|uniref:Uncharacterized protein n=2 Tax=Limosilactobacillus TaxID=2742598 RepID=A0A0R1VBF8_9LACO|nr:hypothetical protein FC60_GL001597 [Limosilactobacillus gastricus DSM 16045]